jgi:hypothetical protein
VTEDPQAFVSLIKGLEIAVGNKSAYPILEPFPCQAFRNGQLDLIAIWVATSNLSPESNRFRANPICSSNHHRQHRPQPTSGSPD